MFSGIKYNAAELSNDERWSNVQPIGEITMNKAYRLIWSKAKERWIIAAEIIKGNGGPAPITVAAAIVTSLIMAASGADALPTGGQVVAGQAAISAPSATQMNISQATNQAIINWNSFGIGKGEAVNITQPSSQSTLLNRVLGNNPSQIFGSLSANGRVFLVNPSGILFAPGASVNVGGLVASSLNIKDSDFMNGKYSFFKDGTAGTVVNQGNISGGFVALLGNSVENAGTIVTTKGTTGLAAGDEITLGFDPNGLMAIKVDKAAYQAQVTNSGVIEADGGSVVMTASAADALLATVVNNSGTIRASSMVERNGEIVLEGGQIINSGTISANGTVQGGNIHLTTSGMVMNTGTIQATGDTGGQIAITAQAVVEQGTVDASGVTQGGSVVLSAGDSLEQTANSVVRADATQGTAGTVRAESVGGAYLSGTLSASGSRGGEVSVTAPNLVLAGAALHADGRDGGGRVRVGGGWQGKDADLANASTTTVNHTDFTANATGNGDGGTVVVWSEQNTLMAGAIEGKGGSTGGNGGKVEISSHGTLALGGTVDVKASAGTNGSLLLDPKDINIVASVGGVSTISLTYPSPQAGDKHGTTAVELKNEGSGIDRVLVISSSDNTAATLAGAARLYRMSDGALLATLTGSQANDQVGNGGVTALSNGNYLVRSFYWNNSGISGGNGKGAMSWGNGTNGVQGVVSSSNSLVGSTASDQVGSGGVTALTNGNYVVSSYIWDNGAVANVGAVTWGNGTTGTSGAVSSSNSLVGSKANDQVGSGGVTALTNGNYVVRSSNWDNGAVVNAGAVTWGNGTTGKSGSVSGANSLVGSTANDLLGDGGVTALTNGNYVVISSNWDNGAVANVGAVTWGNGASGVSGVVSSANSLVGSTANDQVGSGGAGRGGVTAQKIFVPAPVICRIYKIRKFFCLVKLFLRQNHTHI